MTLYMTPWSVMATAGIPISRAERTISRTRHIPSSRLPSVWQWRWPNDMQGDPSSSSDSRAAGSPVGQAIYSIPTIPDYFPAETTTSRLSGFVVKDGRERGEGGQYVPRLPHCFYYS